MYAAINNLEAERFVSTLRVECIQPRVGSHLCTTLISSPILSRGNKSCSDSSAPVCRRNIPSLDVTDRTDRIATVRMRSQINLNKSDKAAARLFGHENDSGQR